MAGVKPETIEPDPSSTGIANDTFVNPEATMEDSSPTADAKSETETNMPSTDEVDKAIAEVEANRKEKEAKKNVAVDSKEHEVTEEEGKPRAEDKKEPSDRVREGQRWNNRDRDRHSKPRKDFRENYKSDLTSQKESSDPVAIRKQVEFYFSDSNLLQDQFLFGKVQGHDNLPVPISTIHSFKRMRHFQPFSAVVEALKESATLNVVNEDHIQRKTPLPEGLKDRPITEIKEVFENEAMKRSVYVKGFGEEVPSTQFDIEAFFAKYGPTNSVRLRRRNDRLFKGSVFVEFDNEETQERFLSLDPKPKWNGQDLIIKSKKQYCDDKVEDIKAGRIKPRFQDRTHGQGRDDRDWKTRRDEDQRNGHRRGGGGKGFGSHKGGRGRGGKFGGARDRNEERKHDRDERNVPKVATTAGSDAEDSKATAKTDDILPSNDNNNIERKAGANDEPVADATSKKRAREEDIEPTEGQALKKLDTKETGS
ncbi:MAG: hypothetical protein Q9201_005535 [Fulgogasparrea decipioides]